MLHASSMVVHSGVRAGRTLVASLAALVLAATLTACTASTGGYVAVAANRDTGVVVLVVQLCEPTKALELEVKISGDDSSTTVWSASGRAAGRQAVVRVGMPPARWQTEVDELVPVSRKLYVAGWTDLDDDDSSAFDHRLVGPAFVPDELPLTTASAPEEVVFEVHGEARRGSLAAFTTAATTMCDE